MPSLIKKSNSVSTSRFPQTNRKIKDSITSRLSSEAIDREKKEFSISPTVGKPQSVGWTSTMSDSEFPPLKKKRIEPNHHLNRMFLDGSLSDITIKAFDRAWNLHKFVLFSSPYFMSLFTKDWKDSKEKVLQLQIPDQTVTAEALHVCLQSMYAFEIEFSKANVVPMLAAATFLQLDDQIQSCYEFIAESMQMDSIVEYLGIVATYGGGKAVEIAAFEYLENYLTTIRFQNELPKIDVELMSKVAARKNLFCGDEDSLYATIIIWLYIKITGLTFEESLQSYVRVKRALDYFENLEGSIPFLSTDAGRPYVNAFRLIRIRDLLIIRIAMLSSLKRHKIFPNEWLEKASAETWERIDKIMSNTHSLSQDENYFNENCVRFGASYDKFQSFSMTSSNVLINLQLTAQKSGNKWIIKIKRTKGMMDPKPDEKKEILVRGRVVKMTQNGKNLFTLTSEIKKTSLKVGEEFEVLQTEEKLDDCNVNVSTNYLF